MAFQHHAIHGNFFTGADAQGFAQADVGDGDIHFLPFPNDPCRARLQANQLTDSRGSLAPRFHLQGRAKVDEGQNNRRRLEISMFGLGGQNVGEVDGDGGEQPAGARAEGNQRVHIGLAVLEGVNRPPVKMPARINHHPQSEQRHDKPEPATR